MKERYLILCDIDGTILSQHDEYLSDMLAREPEILPGVKKQFNEWSKQGNIIILTTARPESCRERTEEQLHQVGLFWNMMIMDCPNSPRFLINDVNPGNPDVPRAIAINLNRNEGMKKLDLELASKAQLNAKEIYKDLLGD